MMVMTVMMMLMILVLLTRVRSASQPECNREEATMLMWQSEAMWNIFF